MSFLKSSKAVQLEHQKRAAVTVKILPLLKIKTNTGGYTEVEEGVLGTLSKMVF